MSTFKGAGQGGKDQVLSNGRHMCPLRLGCLLGGKGNRNEQKQKNI